MSKILVLSFEPISSTLSNGRTLKNLLYSFPTEDIINIYIHGSPDINAGTFYRVSDKQALRSMFLMKPKYVAGKEHNDSAIYTNKSIFRRRSNFKLFIRELAWSNRRIKKLLFDIADRVKPDAIVVFLGNGGFMMNNAVYLSKKLNIPLISYNCEDYYFKDYDYVKYINKIGLFHRLYKKTFVKAFNYFMDNVSSCVYLTEDLKQLYDNKFKNSNGQVVYNSSLLVNDRIVPSYETKSKSVVYAGNIALGRLEELEKIGHIIKEINPEYNLEVYSGEDRQEFLEKVINSKDISFKGSLSYDNLLPILKHSFAILHIDSLNPFFKKHTIHGFSTKIPDSLSTGNCFVVLSAKESSVYKYLNDNQCAYCASNIEEIKNVFKELLSKPSERMKYVDKAIAIAKSNHSLIKNSVTFKSIVERSIYHYNNKL